MEAKDIKWCPQHGYPLPCHKCGMPLSQTSQKEIYQAGIREVVEWIEQYPSRKMTSLTNPLHGKSYTLPWGRLIEEKPWQDQKKVWGVDKPKK